MENMNYSIFFAEQIDHTKTVKDLWVRVIGD
jgi:hypothetical protein